MAEHDHSGPDWKCEACRPLADVLRARMRWGSVHWGTLHDDAYPSLAKAVHHAGYVQVSEKVRTWVKDVAYAEDDFVVDEAAIKALLDSLDPNWRNALDFGEDALSGPEQGES